MFGRAMSAAERQARCRAALARKRAAAAPVDDGVMAMSASEMISLLKIPTMPAPMLAALRAQPGAVEDDDDQQPPLDEFGEPIYSDE